MKQIVVLVLLFAFFGCNDKQRVGYFDQERTKQQAIIGSKRSEFTLNNKRFLMIITYLNAIDTPSIKRDSEKFLVTIYANKKVDFKHFITSVKINDSKKIDIKRLRYEDKLVNFSPIKNPWSSYFLITTNSTKKESISLTLLLNQTKKVNVSFLKALQE